MHRTVNWLLMLATLAGACALYAVKDETRRLEARVQGEERALERAENDVAVLAAERAHLSRPERLEPLARKLGMAPVGAGQYLRVDAGARVSSPSSVVHTPLLGEGQGGGDAPTSAGGVHPTPNPSPQGGGEAATILRRSYPPQAAR